jgi:MFS family permease
LALASTNLFPALRSRNFLLLWLGLGVSFAGSFMQQAAILWQVSLLVPSDRRALALGMVGLVRVIPIVGFSLLSGVAADGVEAVWPVYVLAALGASVGAFDPPARHALVPMLVPREHLPNALSLNSVMAQIASVAGPAIGGLIIAKSHLGWTYVFNAVSFLFVVVALAMMRDVPETDRTSTHARDEISIAAMRDGLRFVFRSPMIRSTMLLDFFATFFSSAMALLPIFAQDILHVGAQGYGWLYSASAVGAVAGSMAMVPLAHRIERRGPTLIWAVFGYGVATVVFGLSRSFWLTFACLAWAGASDAVSMVIRNLVRQLETPDALRGRTIGINMVFFMGGPQLGELEAGLVANWLGAPFSVLSGGVACLIATAAVVWRTPELRHYRK